MLLFFFPPHVTPGLPPAQTGLVIQDNWGPQKSEEYVEYRKVHYKNLIHLQLWPGCTGAKQVVDLVGQRPVKRGMTRGAQIWV